MISRLDRFQDSTHALLNWFLDIRSETLDIEGEHRALELASHISLCDGLLLAQDEGIKEVTIPSEGFDKTTYTSQDADYRYSVVNFQKYVNDQLGEYISHCFLLGSLATLDYKRGWSDVDAFMVLKEETMLDSHRLNELRNLCLKAWPAFLEITPLQHHGFIVSCPKELKSYPSYYMPPEAFKGSIAMLEGQAPLSFKIRERGRGSLRSLRGRERCLLEACKTGIFKHHPKNGVYLHGEFKHAHNNMYQLYCLLGYIMTVPAYFMDAINQPCYKGDSFQLARGHFSDESWSIIDRATQVRSVWEAEEGTGYIGNAIPVWLQDILGKDFMRDSLRLIQEAIKNIECIHDEI